MNIDLGTAIVLIICVAAHIVEEVIAGVTRFFNIEWFSGTEDCPISRTKSLLVDEIGLFLLLATLALLGSRVDPRWFLTAIGIVSADTVLHSIFTIGKQRYTPGIATCALYVAFLIYFFSQNERRDLLRLDWAWLAVFIGLAAITVNYFIEAIMVWSGRCGSTTA